MDRWTISVPDDVAAEVMRNLSYGDNRSEWVVDAIERKLATDEEPAHETPAPEADRLPELPGHVDRAAAEHAVAAVVALLQEGPQSMSAIVRQVMPQHPLGYDPDEAIGKLDDADARYRGGWWRTVIRPALESHPDVAKPAAGGSKWRLQE